MKRENIKVVEVSVQGNYVFEHRAMKLDQIGRVLEKERQSNPDLVLFIRADKNVKLQYVANIFELSSKLKVPISLRADPGTDTK